MREGVIIYETHLKICVRKHAVKKSRDLHISDTLLRPLCDLVTPSNDEPSAIFKNQTSPR
jgi:hypothetical protein